MTAAAEIKFAYSMLERISTKGNINIMIHISVILCSLLLDAFVWNNISLGHRQNL